LKGATKLGKIWDEYARARCDMNIAGSQTRWETRWKYFMFTCWALMSEETTVEISTFIFQFERS